MTNEQINTAIGEIIRPALHGNIYRPPRDFCNDLNAMHEAEKRLLNDEQWLEYREELRNVVLGGIRMVSQWCKADLHATARQRAEAFLRTIGKWEGEK